MTAVATAASTLRCAASQRALAAAPRDASAASAWSGLGEVWRNRSTVAKKSPVNRANADQNADSIAKVAISVAESASIVRRARASSSFMAAMTPWYASRPPSRQPTVASAA